MEYPTKKRLPLKLNLEMVAAELGLLHLSEPSQLEAILQYQRDYGLILKSNSPLNGIGVLATQCYYDEYDPESGNDEERYDYEGYPALICSGDTFRLETNGDTLILGPVYHTGLAKLTFNQFCFEGEYCCAVDNNEYFVVSISCDASDVYVSKDDLIGFLGEKRTEIPDYANPAGEHYAPELVLAIELHTALRVKNEGNQRHSMRDRVDLWLRKHHSGLSVSGARATRLAAIIGDAKKIP
jgi:hypothetical protein